jgi:hypothetical protein
METHIRRIAGSDKVLIGGFINDGSDRKCLNAEVVSRGRRAIELRRGSFSSLYFLRELGVEAAMAMPMAVDKPSLCASL